MNAALTVEDTMVTPTFTPTHRITFTPRRGSPVVTLVALHERGEAGTGGPAYDREEYETYSTADWYRGDDGSWTHLGQATPGGANGAVEVVSLAN